MVSTSGKERASGRTRTESDDGLAEEPHEEDTITHTCARARVHAATRVRIFREYTRKEDVRRRRPRKERDRERGIPLARREVVTVRRCGAGEKKTKRRIGRGASERRGEEADEKNLRRFHAWRAVKERAGRSQTGPPALLVARKAGSCQPAYRRAVAHYTGREREKDETREKYSRSIRDTSGDERRKGDKEGSESA